MSGFCQEYSRISQEWLVSRILKRLVKSGYEPKEYSIKPGVAYVKNTQWVSPGVLRTQRILD